MPAFGTGTGSSEKNVRTTNACTHYRIRNSHNSAVEWLLGMLLPKSISSIANVVNIGLSW